MYGLWLFKELRTEYGHCKVEVYRKGYTASAVEIGGFVGNSLNLALENLDTITAPIGKSVCSFAIYDTDQVEYDDLFTPDATAYKVVVSTKVDGGEYNTRWSGYVTPDFFAENLSFRTPISISARDNIGYLNDVDFDLDTATITVRELIQAAFNRIAEDYPMSLSFVTQKQTEEGILAIDATISTYLLREMSWYEALETVLHDLGLQMRWVDNNTIAVLDISQLGENFGLQRFNFIERSGYREILPAWRELSQKQDYGLRENFFEGKMTTKELAFVKTQSLTVPDLGFRQDVRYYKPTNWGVARDIYTTDPSFYNSTFGNRLIFSAVSETYPDTTYLSWSTNVLKSNVPLTVKCKALNSIIYPSGGVTPYPLQLKVYDPFLAFGSREGDHLQIGLRMNLFLHTRDNKTYVMNKEWVEDNGTGSGNFINLTLDKVSLDAYNVIEGEGAFPIGSQPQEQELTITANTIPYDGILELRIYGYYVVSYQYADENIQSPNFDKFFTYIDNLTYTFDSNDISSGQESKVQVSELHNIKEDRDYSFGQVPLDSGGINAYAGGLFKANGDELVGFKRNVDGSTYPLLELVGREIIHFNKKNYNKLSGTIKNLAKEPLRFDKVFIYKGKNYLPFACSLDVISNTMNITTMQEVEPYMTYSFVEIKSELVTGGGATISGGNNTALQYSAEVGNAKRISELNNASESEKKEAYVVIDNVSWPESKKVPFFDIVGLNEAQVGAYLTENKYATQSWVAEQKYAKAADVTSLSTSIANIGTRVTTAEGNISENATAITNVSNRVADLEAMWYIDDNGNLHTTYNIVSDKDVVAGGEYSGGSGGGGSTGLGTVIIKTVSGQEYKTDSNGVVTIPDYQPKGNYLTAVPSGYATEIWVGDNYQPKGNYLTGITSIMVTTALGYVPFNSTSFTKTTIKSTLGIADWALAVSKPSYSWSEITGKPSFANIATSGKYSDLSGVPTSLPASDVYAWAKKASLAASDVPNLDWSKITSGKPTTLAGYGITDAVKYVGRASVDSARHSIGYDNGSQGSVNLPGVGGFVSADQGSYGFQLLGTPAGDHIYYRGLYGGEVKVWRELYHTGNFNPANYLPLSGGTITSTNVAPLSIRRNGTGGAFISFENNNGRKGYIGITNTSILYFYAGDQIETPSRILHEGNYSAYALPKNGGTITGSSTVPLYVHTTDTTQCTIVIQSNGSAKASLGWGSSAGSYIYNYASGGRLGIKDDGTPYFGANTLVHSGNIGSQSVNSAKKLYYIGTVPSSGFDANAALSGGGRMSNYGSRDWWGSTMPAMSYGTIYQLQGVDADNHLAGQLAWDVNHANTTDTTRNLWWRANDNSNFANAKWHQIAFTDSNVASATKLQTARTIWGNSFDGSGDVDGNLSVSSGFKIIGASSNIFEFTAGGLHVGYGLTGNYITQIYGGNGVYLRYGADRSYGLTIDSEGHTKVHKSFAVTEGLNVGKAIVVGECLYMNNNQYIYCKDSNGESISTLYINSHNLLAIGYGTVAKGYSTAIYGGGGVNLRYGTSGSNGLTIDSEGYTKVFKSFEVAGNTYLSADVTITGQVKASGDGVFGSDARYKSKLQDLAVDIETIANAPVFSYRWTDREDDKVHLGTTAQYWLPTKFCDAVDTSNPNFYHLNYGALGVAIGVMVAKKVVNHEERIKELEERVKNLEIENKQLRQWHN